MQEPDEIARQNEELWDSRAQTYDTRFGFTRGGQRKLLSLIQLGDNPRVLDLACGPGFALREAANRTHGQGEFYGVDNSAKMIEVAQTKSKTYSNLRFYKSQVEELPFDDHFFDVIISSNAFHHFSNPEKALEEARRVLKPRGRLYILDMTANNALMRFFDKFMHRLEPAHVKLYSRQEFQAFFEKAELRYVRSVRIDAIPPVEVHIAEKPDLNLPGFSSGRAASVA